MADEANNEDLDNQGADLIENNDDFDEFADKLSTDEQPPVGELDDEEVLPDPNKQDEEPGEGADDEPDTADNGVVDSAEDVYAGWPEEAIAAVRSAQEKNDRLEHQLRSDAGRVRAFQTKYQEATNEIQRLKEAGGGNDDQASEAALEALNGGDEEWSEFQENFPEFAAAIDNRLKRTEQAVETAQAPAADPAQDNSQSVDAAAENVDYTDAYSEVAKTFPTWQQEVQKPEFGEWLLEQPVEIRALAESDDPRAASTLIGEYDLHLVANGNNSLRADPNSVSQGDAASLEARRQEQLESGGGLPSKNAGVNVDGIEGEDEFDRSFEFYASRKDAQTG